MCNIDDRIHFLGTGVFVDINQVILGENIETVFVAGIDNFTDGKNMTSELIFDCGEIIYGGFKPHVSIKDKGKRVCWCGVSI